LTRRWEGGTVGSADLIERYEYTPYGQRTVYSHGWYLADVTQDGKVSSGGATQPG